MISERDGHTEQSINSSIITYMFHIQKVELLISPAITRTLFWLATLYHFLCQPPAILFECTCINKKI